VKKKSFLLATILTPLLFIGLIAGVTYFGIKSSGNEGQEVYVLDESGYFSDAFENGKYEYTTVTGSREEAKEKARQDDVFALLILPEVDLKDSSKTFYDGFAVHAENTPSIQVMGNFRSEIRQKLESIKLDRSGLDPNVIASLKVSIDLDSFDLNSAEGEEVESNSGLSFGLGYAFGFLIYMFIFIYGSQIMQSVLAEKTSRIVEVIVSSVRPFHLMMGKVLGVGAVGFTQLFIWIALMFTLSTVGINVIGTGPEMIAGQLPQDVEITQAQEMMGSIQGILDSIPVVQILVSFLFYFLGAYLLYGALYAAVGSAVDSIQDAQQFMMPIIIPIIAAIASLTVVLQDPHGPMAVGLSLFPFTSPIVMMARIPFGVPMWQLLLSMTLLIVGFIGTIWVAGRIYRIGILMYGVKVNWKTLKVWFTMKV
jgi:ABC-2 type transport system permease protein